MQVKTGKQHPAGVARFLFSKESNAVSANHGTNAENNAKNNPLHIILSF
jgi:hypothetical protein